MSGAVDNLTKNPYVFVGGVIVLGVAAYLLVRKIASDVKDQAVAAAKGIGGLASGDNAITDAARTDAYKGAGILGTLGASFDILGGGIFSKTGEWLGGVASDWADSSTNTAANKALSYTAIFPDGAKYTVAASRLDANGFFVSGSTRYKLSVNQANQTVAVPV